MAANLYRLKKDTPKDKGLHSNPSLLDLLQSSTQTAWFLDDACLVDEDNE